MIMHRRVPTIVALCSALLFGAGAAFEHALERRAAPGRDYKLLDEVLDTLKKRYHDPGLVDEKRLIEAAARGMCASLDPYTTFFDETELRKFKEEDLGGRYAGIGARLAMRRTGTGDFWPVIVSPVYSGPAYRAGLRTNDWITSVEGVPTRNKMLHDAVHALRGPPGDQVSFKVMRRGWTEERRFTLRRAVIHLETTQHEMLPGGLAYVRLTTFGDKDAAHVRAALEDSARSRMKAVILDLRGNTGGRLSTAMEIASCFLEEGKLVYSTRGSSRKWHMTSEGKLTDVPLLILIDGQSASASEVLAGALRDHERATLIGRRSFGKGSVQVLEPLFGARGPAALRVTAARWYLPNGDSVEKSGRGLGGVAPDIEVPAMRPDLWKDAEADRLRGSEALASYLERHWAGNKALFRRLAVSDGRDPRRYPGFAELLKALDTRLPADDVRAVVRGRVRRLVQDDWGRPLHFDLQTDRVLQRGIVEACKQVGLEIAEIKAYEAFSRR